MGTIFLSLEFIAVLAVFGVDAARKRRRYINGRTK